MILGIDAGNYKTKVCTANGVYSFYSDLGEYRERQLVSTYGDDDMIWEYNGERGFAGSLAKYECEFLRNMKGDSKAHKDAILRVLLACHRFGRGDILKLIVGQTISRHSDKKRIKEMLLGRHSITVNNEKKSFYIDKVEVAAEGASAFFVDPTNGIVRIIDVGSGTINFASINHGRFVDKDSFTTKDGIETLKSKDYSALAGRIETLAMDKWDHDDLIYLVGGGSKFVYPYLKNAFLKIKILNQPEFANVKGFYLLGKQAYEH